MARCSTCRRRRIGPGTDKSRGITRLFSDEIRNRRRVCGLLQVGGNLCRGRGVSDVLAAATWPGSPCLHLKALPTRVCRAITATFEATMAETQVLPQRMGPRWLGWSTRSGAGRLGGIGPPRPAKRSWVCPGGYAMSQARSDGEFLDSNYSQKWSNKAAPPPRGGSVHPPLTSPCGSEM